MDRDLKRFAQACRRDVRLGVKATQVLPGTTAFVPHRARWGGEDLTRPVPAPIAGCADEAEFRVRIRRLVEAKRARLCAVGGMTSAQLDSQQVTSTYALAVFTKTDVGLWAVGISWDLEPRRLEVHTWEEMPTEGGHWREFVQAILMEEATA